MVVLFSKWWKSIVSTAPIAKIVGSCECRGLHVPPISP